MSDEVVQVWVRTEKGKVFGPLTPTTIELLLDNGIIEGRVQVSLDGSNYVFPGRMPGIRMVFPKTLWGEQVLPPNELDDLWAKAAAPPPLPGAAAPTSSGAAPGASTVPGGPVGVPGGPVPRAGPMAGPGARAQQSRPVQAPPGRPGGAQRPAGKPGAPATLADSLFGDLPGSSPSGVAAAPRPAPAARPAPAQQRPTMSSASVAAAMGQAAPPPPASSPSGVAVSPLDSTPTPPPQAAPSVAAVAALDRIPPAGSLEEVSPLRLYFLAAAQDLTGLLTLQLPDRALMLHFRKGSPDLVDSTHPEDALATFLLRQRLVGPEQLAQAQKEGARFGGELLPALFGLGLLNPNAALEALNQRVAGLIGQALRATEGSFTFQPIDLPAQKAMPAGNRWALFCEQVRKISTAELKARMQGALDFPVMKASGAVPVTDLRLSPQETRAYGGFDGTKTLNQLLQSGAPEAEHALRVAFMLESCDLVSFAGTVIKTTAPSRPSGVAPAPAPVPPPPAAPSRPVITPQASAAVPPAPVIVAPVAPAIAPPAPVSTVVPGNPVPQRAPAYPGAPPPQPARPVVPPPVMSPAASAASAAPAAPARPVISAAPANAPPPATPSMSPQQVEAEVKRLAELLAKMKTQNHFEVLGLTKDSPANAVKVAYFRLAKDFHPDTVPPGAPPSFSKAKADIFARIGDANRTLSDENLRKEYLAELESGGTGEKVDVSKLLQAEECYQKGKILVGARKFPEALKMFDESISLMPEDAEAYAWRGYARFFTHTDKKVGLAEAMKDIQNCLKRNPSIVSAHYFQGMMNKILGDLAAAKKHFNATVKLDPKHIDAQRELRMMK